MPKHQECPECLFIHPSTPPEFEEWETAFHTAFCYGALGNVFMDEIIHPEYGSEQVRAMTAGFIEGKKLRCD
jgi:hypothetical protein